MHVTLEITRNTKDRLRRYNNVLRIRTIETGFNLRLIIENKNDLIQADAAAALLKSNRVTVFYERTVTINF